MRRILSRRKSLLFERDSFLTGSRKLWWNSWVNDMTNEIEEARQAEIKTLSNEVEKTTKEKRGY